MIKIRYRDPSELSPGLHAAAERHGRITVIYLLSGLTVPQRRAALRRLRLFARTGYCPRLPAGQLGLALLADRIRIAVGWMGAVLRLHPARSTVPVMMAAGAAIVFLALSSASIRALPGPRPPGQPPAWGYPPPTAPPSAAPVAGPSAPPAPGWHPAGAAAGRVITDRSGPPSPPSPEGSARPRGPRGSGGTGGSTTVTGTPGSGGPPGGTASTAPASGPADGTSPPARPSPTTTGMPSAAPGDGPEGEICLDACRWASAWVAKKAIREVVPRLVRD